MRIVLAVFALFIVPAAFASDDGHHGMAGHKHIALFVGSGQEEDKAAHTHSATAIGLEFEYRLNDEWGIGGVVERLRAHGHDNTVVVVPVSYHFGGNFRAFAGPGWEFDDRGGKDKFLARLGFGYEFHINDHWTVAPEALVDFVENGHKTWLLGIAIGYGF